MKVKQLTEINEEIDQKIFNFFLQSRPVDFSGLTSKHLFQIKSREFVNTLYTTDNIYSIFEEEKLLAIVFFEPTKNLLENSNEIILEFVYGNGVDFHPTKLINGLHEILKFTQEKFNKNLVVSNIERKNKKNKFINWLKRYDKKCEIFKKNNTLKIQWKYEKFS